ncbi:MAG: UDP-glucose 4-epimerase GalE [Erysipelotrichales bacterium]|nr:UDP-glucose 4-epimerase GalE [Erysipelotrichales bacterium]
MLNLRQKPCILVTGGAGFIGSHTVCELLDHDYDVVMIDDFYNAKPEVLDAIRTITKKDFVFEEGDCADRDFMDRIFREHTIDAVIHFAGYKAVGESVAKPLMYYRNNLDTTLTLLETMKKHGCHNLVFSSSATVYAYSEKMPLYESNPLGTTNPYGETKRMIERILTDVSHADPEDSFICLRYFNPVGAHPSGLIGEDPNGIPNNLMPFIVKVATGKIAKLRVFGNDYDTPDGTGMRDYIHVVDLAKAHLLALNYAFKRTGIDYINVGTGNGTSVLEMVESFRRVNRVDVPYEIVGRRPGDLAKVWADTSYAKKTLGFTAEKTIDDMCHDAYNYGVKHMK